MIKLWAGAVLLLGLSSCSLGCSEGNFDPVATVSTAKELGLEAEAVIQYDSRFDVFGLSGDLLGTRATVNVRVRPGRAAHSPLPGE